MVFLMMRSVSITGSIGCLLAVPAFAQSDPLPAAWSQQPPPGQVQPGAPSLSPVPVPVQRDTPAPAQPGSPKSETTANLLTLGGVLLPVGLVIGAATSLDSPPRYSLLMTSAAASMLFTPSAGHWYTGKVFTPGLGLRVAGGLVALIGVASEISHCGPQLGPDGGSCGPGWGAVLVAIGGATAAAGIIHDAVTAPRRVRRYNREHGVGVEVGIAPVVARGSTGLALAGRF